MKTIFPLFLFFLFTLGAQAQLPKESIIHGKVAKRGTKYAKTINKDELKKHLFVLAADSLEGRDTGSKGMQKAAAYIANHFQVIGLQAAMEGQNEKVYFQPFHLEKHTQEEGYIVVNGKKYLHLEDIVMWGGVEETLKEVVFVGFGYEADYEGKDIGSKAVLVMNDYSHDYLQVAKAKGANMVFYLSIDTTYSVKNLLANNRKAATKPTLHLPSEEPVIHVKLSEELAAGMLGVDTGDFLKLMERDSSATLTKLENAPPVFITIGGKEKVEKVVTQNVLGFVEGSDKREEAVVITAHYDHVGIGRAIKGDSIYNGADDDASGTSAVMELAQAFALAKQEGHGPRRSLLFLAFTGEEIDLWGSVYYLEHPLFPLQNTVTNINIDMIGRADSAHINNAHYLYVVGADRLSTELHLLNEAVNKRYLNLGFDYKYNAKDDAENLYERSDHYNFAKRNIPIVFFTSGLHPDYHKPSDSAEKIAYEALEKRTQMIFHLAWEIANRNKRVKLNSVSVSK